MTSTSRNEASSPLLLSSGASSVLVDDGTLASKVAGQFDKVLEMIGTTTLQDSLKCTREGGIVCVTGIVGNQWMLDAMNPMDFIPSAVCLTAYSGGPDDFMRTPLEEIAGQVERGEMQVQIGKVYQLEEIVEAHRMMESNKAGGKIVVLT